MDNPFGSFTQEALESYQKSVAEREGVEFSENGIYDFTRCMRPDGTFYGTRGKCREGTEVGAKEVVSTKNPERPAPSSKVTSVQKEKPVQTAQESKGYKPKERSVDSEPGPVRRAKDAIREKLGIKRQDGITNVGFKDKAEVDKHYESMRRSAERVWKGKALENRLKEIDQEKKKKIAALEVNKKFVEDLKKEMPKDVKMRVDGETGEIVMTTKIGKNTVEATFSPSEGFNYNVNGGYDRGTVTDRKEQLRAAQAVRQMWDATVRSAPEGTVFKTSAYSDDGYGDARQKAYQRIGFGEPQKAGYMYGVKRNGRVEPENTGNGQKLLKAAALDFTEAEGGDQDSAWAEVLFPRAGLQK